MTDNPKKALKTEENSIAKSPLQQNLDELNTKLLDTKAEFKDIQALLLAEKESLKVWFQSIIKKM